MPHAPPDEDWHKEQKEDSRHFEPHDAAHAAERTQKSPNPARDIAAFPSGGLSRRLSHGPAPICRVHNRLWPGPGRGLIAACKPLAHHAAANAQPRSKNPSNGLWSHSVYDGSSDAGCDASRNLPPLSVCS